MLYTQFVIKMAKFQLGYILHSQVHFSATTVFVSIFSFEITPFLRYVFLKEAVFPFHIKERPFNLKGGRVVMVFF